MDGERESVNSVLSAWLNEDDNDDDVEFINPPNGKGTILQKINVSFIAHFCLGKYSFSLDTFKTHFESIYLLTYLLHGRYATQGQVLSELQLV